MQPSESASPPLAPTIPAAKRAIAFFDGQNLFHAAREAFGYTEPNYDPLALAHRLCQDFGWQLQQVHFYTGVPGHQEDPRGYQFWTAKLQGMRNAKVEVFQRPLRYRHKQARLPLTLADSRQGHFILPDGNSLMGGTKLYLPDGRELPAGTELSVRVAEEKGIDVRLAIDFIRLALQQVYDVGILFTQDQDLAEAAREVKTIAGQQQRTIDLYSAFPAGGRNTMGVQHTQFIEIDAVTFAACLDPRDYRQTRRRR